MEPVLGRQQRVAGHGDWVARERSQEGGWVWVVHHCQGGEGVPHPPLQVLHLEKHQHHMVEVNGGFSNESKVDKHTPAKSPVYLVRSERAAKLEGLSYLLQTCSSEGNVSRE